MTGRRIGQPEQKTEQQVMMDKVLDDMMRCTGCTACEQTCPQAAIRMAADGEGFLFPQIDAVRCNDCGRCRRICPVGQAEGQQDAECRGRQVFACFSHDGELRRRSSSGGVFSVLASDVLSQGGVVFGAGFDPAFRVVHRSVDALSELDDIRRSKYVQSDLGDTFLQVRGCLEAGRKVLFCGTPCQAAGLSAYLGREHDGLLTCDFVCSGVPSPRVWQMHLAELSERHGGKPVSVSFRNKAHGWTKSHMTIEFDNSARYDVPLARDAFFIGFGRYLLNRRSCADCHFRTTRATADISLGDYWGIQKTENRAYADNRGVSLVVTHTDKGRCALERIRGAMHVEARTWADAESGNPRMRVPSPPSPQRAAFFSSLAAGRAYPELRRTWMDNESWKFHFKRFMKTVLNEDTVRAIRRVFRR